MTEKRKDYPKIDIYVRDNAGIFQYYCTTTWSRTVREAAQSFIERYPSIAQKGIKARRAK